MSNIISSFLCIILSTILFTSNAAVILGDNKCFGNQIFIGFRCQTCYNGQVAINNKCVRPPDSSYGSNFFQKQKDPTNIFSRFNEPCLRKNPKDANICMECNKKYELFGGKCVQKDCKIYFQALNKCLDSIFAIDLQKLAQIYQKNKIEENKINNEGSFVVGAVPTYSITQSQIDLNLPQSSLHIQPFQDVQNGLFEDDINSENSVMGEQGSSKKQTNACLSIQNYKCTKCIQGYFLDLLTNDCKLINKGIKMNLSPIILGSSEADQIKPKLIFISDGSQNKDNQI